MTPPMQLGGMYSANGKGSSAVLNGDLHRTSSDKDKKDSNPRKLGDTRQGNISVEIWKRAFTDALKRLCPLQGEGLECGCLPALNRMVGLQILRTSRCKILCNSEDEFFSYTLILLYML